MKILHCGAIIPAILLLSSCSRIIDFKRHHPGADEHFCPIVKFSLQQRYPDPGGPLGSTAAITVTNNSNGDPVYFADESNTGWPHYRSHLYYDNKHRLTQYRMDGFLGPAPADSIVIFRFEYSYPDPRHILHYEYLLPPSDPNIPYHPPAHLYTLDEQGRIIYDSLSPGSLQNITHYTYNAEGNLANVSDWFSSTNYTLYDDKVNWRQTGKTWQLLELNYSRNNANDPAISTVSSYNGFGLPQKIVYQPGHGTVIVSAAYTYDAIAFQYACDPPKGPVGQGY